MNDSIPKEILENPTLYEGTYLEFLGFRLTDWKEGFARLEMPVRAEHRNTVGYLHGGVIASLLDIAGAVSGSFGVAEQFVSVTVNLNCNYMSPHRAEMVIAEGELIRSTRSLFLHRRNCLTRNSNGFVRPRLAPTNVRNASPDCRPANRS